MVRGDASVRCQGRTRRGGQGWPCAAHLPAAQVEVGLAHGGVKLLDLVDEDALQVERLLHDLRKEFRTAEEGRGRAWKAVEGRGRPSEKGVPKGRGGRWAVWEGPLGGGVRSVSRLALAKLSSLLNHSGVKEYAPYSSAFRKILSAMPMRFSGSASRRSSSMPYAMSMSILRRRESTCTQSEAIRSNQKQSQAITSNHEHLLERLSGEVEGEAALDDEHVALNVGVESLDAREWRQQHLALVRVLREPRPREIRDQLAIAWPSAGAQMAISWRSHGASAGAQMAIS